MVVHFVILGGVFVASVWKIEPLDAAPPAFHVSVIPDPPPAAAAGAAQTTSQKIVPRPQHIANHIVTPPEVKPPPEAVADVGAGSGSGSGSGSGDGSGSGSGDGSGSGSGECQFPPCGPAPEIPAAAPVEPPKPRFVAISKLKRISGDPQIQAPDLTKIQMSRDGVTKTSATFTICLDGSGALTSIKLAHSSGYSGYDDRLTEGIRSWRYQPFMVDGKGVPVCSAVTFIYRIE